MVKWGPRTQARSYKNALGWGLHSEKKIHRASNEFPYLKSAVSFLISFLPLNWLYTFGPKLIAIVASLNHILNYNTVGHLYVYNRRDYWYSLFGIPLRLSVQWMTWRLKGMRTSIMEDRVIRKFCEDFTFHLQSGKEEHVNWKTIYYPWNHPIYKRFLTFVIQFLYTESWVVKNDKNNLWS